MRDTVLAIAADAGGAVSRLSVDAARTPGFGTAVVEAARREGVTTLGQFAAQLRRQRYLARIEAHRRDTDPLIAQLDALEVRRPTTGLPTRPRVVLEIPLELTPDDTVVGRFTRSTS